MADQNINGTKVMDIDPASSKELFPIRVFAERTSVAASTLRAWERRYGLLQPERTPKGHRLYSESDIQKVRKVINLLNDGHSLPVIAEMLSLEQMRGKTSKSSENEISPKLSLIWEKYILSTIEANSDFNVERIDSIYNEASSLYPLDMVTENLIQPVLGKLGNVWKEFPEKGIAEEHFYTSWLKNKLGARFHHAWSQARGTRIVCACFPGTYHEIGLMLFSLTALARGYRVLYFGADMPLNQLHYIAKRSAAKAIVLGIQSPPESVVDTKTSIELSDLVSELSIPVFLGGASDAVDVVSFERSGGIMLGSNISVALKVFEGHVAVHNSPRSEK